MASPAVFLQNCPTEGAAVCFHLQVTANRTFLSGKQQRSLEQPQTDKDTPGPVDRMSVLPAGVNPVSLLVKYLLNQWRDFSQSISSCFIYISLTLRGKPIKECVGI